MAEIAKKFSSGQGHRDQGPNRTFAKEIVHSGGIEEVKEIVDFFLAKPDKDLQKDAVLTMAWVAEERPELIVPHSDFLIDNFNSELNRVVFGSMIALAEIAHLIPSELYPKLPEIIEAMESGTVVTRDYGFRILIVIYGNEQFREDLLFVILEQIRQAPSNQLGQYTERFMKVMDHDHRTRLIAVLEDRREDLINEYHLKRLDKNLKKLHK